MNNRKDDIILIRALLHDMFLDLQVCLIARDFAVFHTTARLFHVAQHLEVNVGGGTACDHTEGRGVAHVRKGFPWVVVP